MLTDILVYDLSISYYSELEYYLLREKKEQ